MPLSQSHKKTLFSQYGHSEKDTGSPQSQIAMMTERINELTAHLKSNPKDFSCLRGMMKLVGQRRRLQNYLRGRLTHEQYRDLLQKLNLRK